MLHSHCFSQIYSMIKGGSPLESWRKRPDFGKEKLKWEAAACFIIRASNDYYYLQLAMLMEFHPNNRPLCFATTRISCSVLAIETYTVLAIFFLALTSMNPACKVDRTNPGSISTSRRITTSVSHVKENTRSKSIALYKV